MKDEGGSVALNPDPMSGMKDEPDGAECGAELGFGVGCT